MKKLIRIVQNINTPNNIKVAMCVWFVFRHKRFLAFDYKIKMGMSFYYAHKQVKDFSRKELKEFLKEQKKETPEKKLKDFITFLQNK